MSSLWLHGILARMFQSTRCWLHSKRAFALRVIDFVNVTGIKFFFAAAVMVQIANRSNFPRQYWDGRFVIASVARALRGPAGSGQFASQARRTVYFWFALSNFSPVRSAVSNAEAHIPTQPSSPVQDARVSVSHEDQERTGGDFPPSRQGTQARLGKAGLP